MKKIVYIFLSIGLLFSSCKKEEITVLIDKLTTNTSQTIKDIQFVNQNVGYAVGGIRWESGVILKTIDGGNTWQKKEDLSEVVSLYGVDFRDENIGIAVGITGKIMRTDDGGQYWDIFQQGKYEFVKDIVMIGDQKTIVAGGEGDSALLLISQDVWWQHERIDFKGAINDLEFVTATEGYAVGNGFVQKTYDGGHTWQYLDIRNDNFTQIDFVNASTGFLCGFQGSIWTTNDAGASWQRLEKNNKVFTRRNHFEDIQFYDENLGLVVGHQGVVYLTKNGGTDWQKIKTDTSIDFKTIDFVDNSTVYIAGEEGAIWRLYL